MDELCFPIPELEAYVTLALDGYFHYFLVQQLDFFILFKVSIIEYSGIHYEL
jgi:hypothetical protein